jgi:hypothetical protein
MPILLSNKYDRKSINLDTQKGTHIDNYQVFELSFYERNQFSEYTNEKYPFSKHRNSPSPIYDCHGLIFASSRTNIDNSIEIRKIIYEDGYKEIKMKETLEGDIVLYILMEDHDIFHSGIIVKAEHKFNNISNIWVLSKWGKYKEVIHEINNCPYSKKKHYKEFYRIDHEQFK